MSAPLRIVEADLDNAEHAAAIVQMVHLYAQDPMGGGTGLSEIVRQNLAEGLRAHPACHVWLAYLENEPVGVAVCFRGFSTFSAAPLINVHDLAVVPGMRGQGVGRLLLEAVEQKARELGCCKVTLEVRHDNAVAQGLYRKLGYSGGTNPSLFWTKPIACE